MWILKGDLISAEGVLFLRGRRRRPTETLVLCGVMAIWQSFVFRTVGQQTRRWRSFVYRMLRIARMRRLWASLGHQLRAIRQAGTHC